MEGFLKSLIYKLFLLNLLFLDGFIIIFIYLCNRLLLKCNFIVERKLIVDFFMIQRLFFIISILNALIINSQVIKDTSYSINSEYKKQIKKFPYIKIVESKTQKNVFELNDEIYKTINNRDLHLDAFLKKSKSKLPAVIMVHGGGWKSGNKTLLKPLAQRITEKGYNCFSVEYRLSDESKYPGAIEDVLSAIEFIKTNNTKYNIDTTKIVILGCSSGAQMASLIGTKYANKVKAVINLDGILVFHHPQSKEGLLAANWLGGDYSEKKEIWEDASALTHVSDKSAPILFINSQYERFHAGRDEMIAILNKYKIYNEIREIKDSPHTFWLFNPWFDETLNYITQFLNKQLK